jgi:hypothetical protein
VISIARMIQLNAAHRPGVPPDLGSPAHEKRRTDRFPA